ncbi:MAG: YfcE family phosphodiesterase [bacterium]
MIAIISDIHDNLANLKKALNFCKEKNITALICCGDVTNNETLKYLSENFNNQIYLTEGNMELYDELEKYNNIKFFNRKGGIFEYDNKKIGICHEPYLINDLLKEKPDIIFYGHTHEPWEKTEGKTKIVNPGNISNTRHEPTFATYNPITNELQLHLLDQM